MIIWLTGQPGSGKTTLANSLISKLSDETNDIKIINLDGDDLRSINKNKDYSKAGRIKNISTAISIIRFLANKNFLCIVSIVAPYKFLRDELKDEFKFLEVYLHTDEVRGREHFFSKDYQKPESNFFSVDTTNKDIRLTANEILSIYW